VKEALFLLNRQLSEAYADNLHSAAFAKDLFSFLSPSYLCKSFRN